jgi:hypothetical protein
MKQTPEIVIASQQINSCERCPFFDEPPQSIYDYGFEPERCCSHPSFKFGRWMNEKQFETIPGTEIWIHCPLPDVEQGDNK